MGRTRFAWSYCVLGVAWLLACQATGESKLTQAAAEAAEKPSPSVTATPTPSSATGEPRAAATSGASQAERDRDPEEPAPSEAPGVNAAPEPSQPDSNEAAAESSMPVAPIAGADSNANWISYGRDSSNTRHNEHEQRLSRDSVANLQLKWSWTTAAVTSTPAYRNGRLYFGDWSGSIVALDAASGQEHWRVRDPELAVGQITGSPFADEDAVYVGGIFGFWYRVDRESGALDWTRLASDGGSANSISSLTRIDDYHAGVIYICSGDFSTDDGQEMGTGGPTQSHLFALDAGTGTTRWTAPITGTCYGSVTHANGVVYLASGDGQLRAFADDDGRQLFAAELGQSSAGGVTVADGMLFVSYGWSWSDPAAAGGVKAFGLP